MTAKFADYDDDDDISLTGRTLKMETDFPENPTVAYDCTSDPAVSNGNKTLKVESASLPNTTISNGEYQQRLIRLYIDYARRTGKVDYPPLKKFLHKFCTTDPNTTEIYEEKDFQPANLTKIIDRLKKIRDRVTEIIAEIRYIFGQAIASAEQGSLKLVQEKNRDLERHLEQLVKIVRKYGYLAQSDGQITKIQDDIKYFRQYIKQFLEDPQTRNQSASISNKHSDLRRFDRYLQSLTDRVHTLASLLEKHIEYETN